MGALALRFLPYAGWPLAAFVFWLWLGTREDLAAQVEGEAHRVRVAAAEARRTTAELERNAATRILEQERARTAAAEGALALERELAAEAIATTEDREATIRALMLEGETDDIPDSNECLNVFIRRSALDWVLHTGTCTDGGAGGDTGPGAVCTDPAVSAGADPATGHFSDITYSDALILWGRDRDTVQILNGRLQAIAALEVPE